MINNRLNRILYLAQHNEQEWNENTKDDDKYKTESVESQESWSIMYIRMIVRFFHSSLQYLTFVTWT